MAINFGKKKIKYDSLTKELKEFIKETNIYTIDKENYIIDERGNYPTVDEIEDEKTYIKTGEL